MEGGEAVSGILSVAIAATMLSGCQEQSTATAGKTETAPPSAPTPAREEAYALAGTARLDANQIDALVERAYSLWGAYIDQPSVAVEAGAAAEIVAARTSRSGDGGPSFAITYLMPCSDFGGASERMLAFVHAGHPEWKLTESVRLEHFSSVDSKADLLNVARLPGAKP